MVRVAAKIHVLLKSLPNIVIHTEANIASIVQKESTWSISCQNKIFTFDYLINAAGYSAPIIHDYLFPESINTQEKFLEFKSSFGIHVPMEDCDLDDFPEMCVIGERGTDQGYQEIHD